MLFMSMRKQRRKMLKVSRKNDSIGMLAEENPELPYEFIKEILGAIEEEKAGLLVPYKTEG